MQTANPAVLATAIKSGETLEIRSVNRDGHIGWIIIVDDMMYRTSKGLKYYKTPSQAMTLLSKMGADTVTVRMTDAGRVAVLAKLKREKLYAKMFEERGSMKKWVESEGLDYPQVTYVINRHGKHEHIQRALAKKAGVPYESLWPILEGE